MEMTVENGRGYRTADENAGKEREIGVIPVDSSFSPVVRVKYDIEETRVGQKTNYDRLVMEIWTNGTIAPQMALVEAAKILRKHLNPFVQYTEPGPEVPLDEPIEIGAGRPGADAVDPELERKLNMSLAELELSVRATNCLETEGITTVRELVLRIAGRTARSPQLRRDDAPRSEGQAPGARPDARDADSAAPRRSRATTRSQGTGDRRQ